MSNQQPAQNGSWTIKASDQFQRDIKKLGKNHPVETGHMIANSKKFFNALNRGIPVGNITGAYIHNEPKGVKAMDQKGPTKSGRLIQTRLYIYPEISTMVLHYICAGDKKSQPKDIQYAKNYVLKLTKDDKK